MFILTKCRKVRRRNKQQMTTIIRAYRHQSRLCKTRAVFTDRKYGLARVEVWRRSTQPPALGNFFGFFNKK